VPRKVPVSAVDCLGQDLSLYSARLSVVLLEPGATEYLQRDAKGFPIVASAWHYRMYTIVICLVRGVPSGLL
jgi:hypothetical protein